MAETNTPFAEMLAAWGRMATEAAGKMGAMGTDAGFEFGGPAAQVMFESLGRKPDPERLQALWRTVLEEYMRDVEPFVDRAATVDASGLAKAWTSVLTRGDDAAARAAVQRFFEVAAVKAAHGPEYYADPETTAVAPTPRNLVHREGPLDLYRYDAGAKAEPRQGAPVLLVYSLINRSYILDLKEGYSFVRHLLDQGLDVFVFEWRDEDRHDSDVTMSAFLLEHLHGCVEAVQRLSGHERVSLFGHCMGGPFAALYAARHPENVDRIVSLTAPYTANEGGVVAMWTDRELFAVDTIVERFGCMPGKLIRHTFAAFKPYIEAMKWKMFVENVTNDQVMGLFMAVDRWANDNPDVPGAVFAELMTEIYRDDRLRRGETELHGEAVDLARIQCPILSLAAEDDWIVSPDSAGVLAEIASSEDAVHEVMPGGHVSVMLDPRMVEWWPRISGFLRG
jgi:polyhydroxyalkanoate synthase